MISAIGVLGSIFSAIILSIWLPIWMYLNTPRVHGPVRRAALMFVLMVLTQVLLFVVVTFVLWVIEQLLR